MEPLWQCQAIEIWLLVFVGVALPLCMLRQLEQRARSRFAAQRQRWEAKEDEAAATAAVAVGEAGSVKGAPPPLRASLLQRPPGEPASLCVCVAELCMVSCLAWCSSCAAVALEVGGQIAGAA